MFNQFVLHNSPSFPPFFIFGTQTMSDCCVLIVQMLFRRLRRGGFHPLKTHDGWNTWGMYTSWFITTKMFVSFIFKTERLLKYLSLFAVCVLFMKLKKTSCHLTYANIMFMELDKWNGGVLFSLRGHHCEVIDYCNSWISLKYFWIELNHSFVWTTLKRLFETTVYVIYIFLYCWLTHEVSYLSNIDFQFSMLSCAIDDCIF